jgi:excisionase family DNA binding protein
MIRNTEEYINELELYKKSHNFKYSEIANMLDVTTRTLRRWIREGNIPLPVFRKKIIRLIRR